MAGHLFHSVDAGRDIVLYHIFRAYIKAEPLAGENQKQTALNNADFKGFEFGCAVALAAEANRQRYEAILPLVEGETEERNRYFPVFNDYDFLSMLRDIRKLWKEGTWEKTTDDEFMEYVRNVFKELTFGDDWNGYYMAMREAAVKARRIEPTEEDREWIMREYEVHKAVLDPLVWLVEKLGYIVDREQDEKEHMK